MIGTRSRYTTAAIQTVEAPDGTRQEMRVPFPRSRLITFTFYQTRQNDRVDTLAFFYFGDPTLWWMLANANPEILDWTDIPVGTVLRIPNG